MTKQTFKSIWAVVAGFLVVVILSTATDAILEKTGFLPQPDKSYELLWWMLVIALAYRTVYTIGAGYLTANLAPTNPMKHVKILAILGTFGGIAGIFAGWQYGNHWYPIALAVLAYPSVWLGGKLSKKV